jgi:hypothetical protein
MPRKPETRVATVVRAFARGLRSPDRAGSAASIGFSCCASGESGGASSVAVVMSLASCAATASSRLGPQANWDAARRIRSVRIGNLPPAASAASVMALLCFAESVARRLIAIRRFSCASSSEIASLSLVHPSRKASSAGRASTLVAATRIPLTSPPSARVSSVLANWSRASRSSVKPSFCPRVALTAARGICWISVGMWLATDR